MYPHHHIIYNIDNIIYFIVYMINVFGSTTAEKVLLFIQNYRRGNSNEIARTFEISQSMVWKQLIKFEAEGVLVSVMIGKSRVFEFNPRYAFKQQLSELLQSGIEAMPTDLRERWFMQRRRPRRFGKPL